MPQVINTNVPSLNAQRNMNSSQSALATSLQRLSSGMRINSAKDDAAGLAISERFTTQIRGLNQASRNANDGISLAQTAEGALGEVSNNLQRIRELAVQSRNATNSADDRGALQKEVAQLKLEIDRVANDTAFNGTKLLDGSFTAQAFQIGANQGQTINIDSISDSNIDALGAWTSVAMSNTSVVSGAFTSVTLTEATAGNEENYSLSVGGVSVFTLDGPTGTGSTTTTVAAANIDTALGDATVLSNLATAGITFTGTAAAGTLAFSKTNGTSMNIVVNNDSAAGGFAGADFATGTNTVDDGLAAGTSVSGFANLDISTTSGADNAILAMDAALKSVNGSRADLGAIQNRFQSVISNLATASENLTASRSRIQDADFAAETANLTRNQILQQAGVAMLAQANSLPQNVLSLLR